MNTFKCLKTSSLLILILLLLTAQASLSQTHMELETSLSVSEQYDTNIFLDNQDEESDYLTMVSPSFDFKLLSEHRALAFKYIPTLVSYAQYNEEEVRHQGNLIFGQALTKHLRFDLTDAFISSDEPLASTEWIDGDRKTRDTYQRNNGKAEFKYLFGPENALVLGHSDWRLRTEDESEDDGTILNPYTSISYHITVRNRLDLNYGYSKAHFWTDDNTLASDDYYGHNPGVGYYYLFTPHTTGYLRYNFTTRNFDGVKEDYKVHLGMCGFEHAFSPDASISAGVGYYVQKKEVSTDQTGNAFGFAFNKSFERGSIRIGANSGWDENTLRSRSDNRGFSKYRSADTSVEYDLLESVKAYAKGYYRYDEGEKQVINHVETNVNWKKILGSCGLSWHFLPKTFLVLDYTYINRDDDIEIDSYRVNRASLTLKRQWLSRW